MPTAPPTFIIGVERSGTTLLSLMLDSHSKLAVPYESHFITDFYTNIASYGNLCQKPNQDRLVKDILSTHYISNWDVKLTRSDIVIAAPASYAAIVESIFQAYSSRRGKERWIDKTPAYTKKLYILNKLWPNCRFIHLIRDGRDVASSITRQNWGPNNFVSALKNWNEIIVAARKMLWMLPDERYVEIKYEDLVLNTGSTLANVTNFLGVDFEPNMIKLYMKDAKEKVGKGRELVHELVSRPPQIDRTLAWQAELSKADQAVAFEIAGPTLLELGYSGGVTRHWKRILKKGYYRTIEAAHNRNFV